jgi:SAM-dependent methyltransferase
LILAALGDTRSVVNVGAGAGAYEPDDRTVIAIEPSAVMVAQRPRGRAPVLRALAHALPLRDGSVDAAMAILSVHHWDEQQELGVRELRRVSRGPVVLFTCDAEVSGRMCLMADYLPEVADLDRQVFPGMDRLMEWLGGRTRVEVVPIPCDICDWMLMSFWAHPERCSTPLPATPHQALPACRRPSSSAWWRQFSAISTTEPGRPVTVTYAGSTSSAPACDSPKFSPWPRPSPWPGRCRSGAGRTCLAVS